MLKIHLTSILVALFSLQLAGQTVETRVYNPQAAGTSLVVKTNLLYDLTTTFNVGAELKLSPRYTLDLSVNYNPFTYSNNKKFKHLLIQPELRYWLLQPFKKHFVGFHIQYASYNVGNIDLPFGLVPSLDTDRYQGDMYGAGFSYGYHHTLSSRWAAEATIGLGYNYLNYKRYECQKCGTFIESSDTHYVGPTKIGLSIIYLLK